MTLLTAADLDIRAAFDDLPESTKISRLSFPAVNMRSRKGHAQGIALRRGPTCDHPCVDTLFVSFSELPKGWGSLFICDDRGYFNATYLPLARHPGGMAVSGDTLVVAFENGDEVPWVTYYDVSRPLHPRELTRCPLEQPRGRSLDAYDVGDRRKASAVGAAHRGDELWVVVISQDRYLRILRSRPGQPPRQIASCNASDLNDWPDGKIEGISLLSDSNGQLWLTAQSSTGRWLKGSLGRGPDLLSLFQLIVDGWSAGVQNRSAGDYLSYQASKGIDLGLQRTRLGFDRTSFRWGSSVMELDGKLLVMATERGKSGRLFRRARLDMLDFAHSPVFDWDEGYRA